MSDEQSANRDDLVVSGDRRLTTPLSAKLARRGLELAEHLKSEALKPRLSDIYCLATSKGIPTWSSGQTQSRPGRGEYLKSAAPILQLSEVRRFEGHEKEIAEIAFSPDGHYVVSAGLDRTVRVWNLHDGHEMFCFHGDMTQAGFHCVAFSSGGQYILSGGDKASLVLWDIKYGLEVRRFEGQKGTITSVSFSSDGRHVISCSTDDTVCVWDLKTGNQIRCSVIASEADDEKWDFPRYAISSDGGNVLSGGGIADIRLWNIQTGEQIRHFTGDTGVSCLAFMPHTEEFLSGSYDRTVRLCDGRTGKQHIAIELQTDSGDNNDFVSTTSESDEPDSDQPAETWITSITLDLEGKHAIVGTSGIGSQTVHYLDLYGVRTIANANHSYGVNCVAFTPDNRYAVSGGLDAIIRLWKLPG